MAKASEDLTVLREFGTGVRAARKARDWSQEDLAELIGMDRTTVGKIERGIGNATLLTINKIALALQQDFNSLFHCQTPVSGPLKPRKKHHTRGR